MSRFLASILVFMLISVFFPVSEGQRRPPISSSEDRIEIKPNFNTPTSVKVKIDKKTVIVHRSQIPPKAFIEISKETSQSRCKQAIVFTDDPSLFVTPGDLHIPEPYRLDSDQVIVTYDYIPEDYIDLYKNPPKNHYKSWSAECGTCSIVSSLVLICAALMMVFGSK